MRFRAPEIVLGFLLATGFWSVAMVAIPENQNQHVTQANAQPQEAAKEHKPSKSFRERLSVIWDRTWDDPVAFYTFVLSIFTGLLAVVSGTQIFFLLRTDRTARMTAQAARDSADHIPRVERAYLFVYPKRNWSDAAKLYGETSGSKNPVQVTWTFRNHGKTPAVITGLEVHFEMVTAEPDNTRFMPNSLLDGITIVEPGHRWPLRDQGFDPDAIISLGRELSAEDFGDLAKGHAYLWFYGAVSYQDIFGGDHITRFRWRGGGVMGGFAPVGGPPYNERT